MEYSGENAVIGTVASGVIGLGIGGAVGYAAGRKSSSRRKKSVRNSRKKRNNSSKSRGRKLKFGSPAYRKKYLGQGRRKQKKPYTAGKRKDTSRRRIRYTKNNQPYIIQANGRARFISKKSVRISKKRTGGKY